MHPSKEKVRQNVRKLARMNKEFLDKLRHKKTPTEGGRNTEKLSEQTGV